MLIILLTKAVFEVIGRILCDDTVLKRVEMCEPDILAIIIKVPAKYDFY